MSIIQNPLLFLTLIAIVVGVQALVIYIRNQTKQIFLSLLPNLGLLGLGIVLSLVGYVVALGETGSWAGLGFIILLLVTFMTTTISTLVSLVLIFVIKPPYPTDSNKR
jgi:hypothetical protein